MFGMFGHRITPCSFSTGSTFSTVITLPGGYNFWAFGIQTFAAGVGTATANVYVQVSNSAPTAGFRRVKFMGQYSGGSGLQDFEVPSSLGNYICVAPSIIGWNYVRLELSTVTTNLLSAEIHSMN